MSSTKRSEVQKDLNLFKTFGDKVVITLKSKTSKSFVTKVKDFNYKEEEPRVIFKRCTETIFPTDTEVTKEEEYIIYIKTIKSVDLFEMSDQ